MPSISHTMTILLTCGAGACTTLGPTPATSAIGALPAGRPEGSVKLEARPGYYLSQAVKEDVRGAAIPGAALLLEPDRVLEIPGLVVGASLYGIDGETGFEPVIGYRRRIPARLPIGVGVVASFTRSAATRNGASYEASRGSAEGMGELGLARVGRWLDVSATATLGVTALDAVGSYCADSGYGVECDGDPTNTDAEVSGLFVSGTAGLAVELFHRARHVLHGVRITASMSAGKMPRVVDGEDRGKATYTMIGFSLGTSFGTKK